MARTFWRAPLPAMELTLPDLSAVPFDALDGTRLLGIDARLAPARAVRDGLPTDALDALQAFLDTPAATLADALGIAPRTLSRRRASGRLASDESDRLLRTARLAEMALVALGDPTAAAAWLVEPKRLLGGESPLRHADTAPGARAVEDMLYAVEFTAAA